MEEIPWYWLSRYGSALFLATPFEAKDRLPLIALDDVAALAATALARPGEFVGKTIDVAGDVSSPGDIAALLTVELRQPVAYSQVQVEGVFMYPSASSATGDIEWLRAVTRRCTRCGRGSREAAGSISVAVPSPSPRSAALRRAGVAGQP